MSNACFYPVTFYQRDIIQYTIYILQKQRILFKPLFIYIHFEKRLNLFPDRVHVHITQCKKIKGNFEGIGPGGYKEI